MKTLSFSKTTVVAFIAIAMIDTGALSFYSNAGLFSNSSDTPEVKDATQPAETVSHFLNRFEKIRVFIPSSEGNGHQSASIVVVRRLRELEYTGLIEISYPIEEKSKLRYLFPPFDSNGANHQYFPDLNVVIAPTGTLGRTRLGILGAGSFHQIKNQGEIEGYPVDYLVRFTPYAWAEAGADPKYNYGVPYDESKIAGEILCTQKKSRGRVIAHCPFRHQLHLFRPWTDAPKDLENFLESELGHTPDLSRKIPGLKHLIERSDTLDLMTIYGMSRNTAKLIFILRSLLSVKKLRPDLFDRGIVLPLISGFREHHIQQIKRAVQILNEDDRVLFAEIGDEDLESLLQTTIDDQKILLLRVGNVSMHLFEYLMSISSLPPTVAGVNGRNLLRLLGIPFLRVYPSSQSDFHRSVVKKYQGSAALAEKANKHLSFGMESPVHYRRNELLLESFLIEAKTPGSSIRKLFRESTDRTLQDGNDIASPGIQLLMETLSGPSDPCESALVNFWRRIRNFRLLF